MVSTAAARSNATRRATAVALNQQGWGVVPDLAPGDKIIFYQPVSGRLSRAKDRSRKLVSTFAGPATVLGQMSNVGYLLQGIADGRYYYRHRAALRKVHSTRPPTHDVAVP